MIIVGIERTTDVNHPETRLVKFRSERKALVWLRDGGGVAWPGLAARFALLHHRIRSVYLIRGGFRPPSRKSWWKQRDVGSWKDFLSNAYIGAAHSELNQEGKWTERIRD